MSLYSIWLEHSKMKLSLSGSGPYISIKSTWGCFIAALIVSVIANFATLWTKTELTIIKILEFHIICCKEILLWIFAFI